MSEATLGSIPGKEQASVPTLPFCYVSDFWLMFAIDIISRRIIFFPKKTSVTNLFVFSTPHKHTHTHTHTFHSHKIIDLQRISSIMIATVQMNHNSTISMMVDKVVTSADLRKGRKTNKVMRDLWGLSSSHHRRPTIDGSKIAKSYWPELVGRRVDDEEVKQLLTRNQPNDLLIEVIGLDRTDDLTLEYHAQRVQLFVDDRNVIIHAPQIG